jgi:hypothetical protein
LVLFGCDASTPCIYTARLYHADANCLDAYEPIGLVDADELGAACPGVCLREASGALYVSTLCPPYPSTFEVVEPAMGSDCVSAVQLEASGGSCD